MKNLKISLLFTACAVLIFTSCEKDSTSVNDNNSKYVVSLRTQASAEETADYLLTTNDLTSGEISAVGQGVELAGWNYVGHFGDTYFGIGYEFNEAIGFKENNGVLIEQGKMAFERMDLLTPINDETFLATGAPWGGGSFDCSFQFIDIDGIGIQKTVKHPIYESYKYVDSISDYEQLNAWPTFAFIQGDKIFVSFYPLNGVTWETPNTDTAYMSIYSFPEMKYLKTIKDARTSPIGYYSSQPCVVKDENNNHFLFSSSSFAAGFTQSTKPSGILKINAGEEDFDKNYFFNIEEHGYRVLTAAYAGNNKVVAKVISVDIDNGNAQWGAFSSDTPILNVAIIDLEQQSFTIVNDIPFHGGQYLTPLLVEDNVVHMSVNNGTEAYVYQVYAETASASKGAKIIGNELQGIFLNK